MGRRRIAQGAAIAQLRLGGDPEEREDAPESAPVAVERTAPSTPMVPAAPVTFSTTDNSRLFFAVEDHTHRCRDGCSLSTILGTRGGQGCPVGVELYAAWDKV